MPSSWLTRSSAFSGIITCGPALSRQGRASVTRRRPRQTGRRRQQAADDQRVDQHGEAQRDAELLEDPVAVRSSLAAAITALGGWAILSGAVMIYLAVRRQRPLGGQWLLIISGAGSVLAGTTFVGWTGSAAAGLGALAQYSAGGAVWYLLTALWLARAARRRSGSGDVSPGRRPPRWPGRRSTAPGGGSPC
jgi:hypothetical protein